MTWVRFSKDFRYRPNMAVSIKYRAGNAYNVTRACAEKAISESAASRMKKESKSDPVTDADNG